MNIDGMIQGITIFARNNTIAAVVLGIFILYLLFRHPKALLTIAVLIAMAYGLAELFEALRSKAKI